MTEQIVASRLPLPPPFDLDLFDGDKRVGWLTPDTIGFRGFANETEAMHGAWVAHRALSRRLAQRAGLRPIPIDTEPLALRADDGMHTSGRRIATLVRPAVGGKSGSDAFGFELQFPSLLDEFSARTKALVIYRTLRSSGVRWSLWLRDIPSTANSDTRALRRTSEAAPANDTVAWPVVAGVALSLAFVILALFAARDIAGSFAAVGLGGLLAIRFFALLIGWPARLRVWSARS